MKIFITGIAGFIGSTLANYFKSRGDEVFGIDNLFSGYVSNLSSEILWEKVDIRDEKYFNQLECYYDVVVHLAAQTSGEKSFELPVYDMETNLKGSYHVYQFAKQCHAKLLINMSSMSVYGDLSDIVQEDSVTQPVSLYGNTKLAAENMLRMLSLIEGPPVISLKLFNAYGPKQDLAEMKQGMVSIYLSYILNHDQIVVKGSLDRVRDFIYIEDIISAIVTIIESKRYKTDVYNLSSGQVTSVKDLIELLQSISQINKDIILSRNTQGDIMGFGGSNEKLKSEFGWQPQYSLEAGLSCMVASYKEGTSLE